MSLRDQSPAAALTPLSPAVFHILLSLGGGERHGWAIKREIAARTDGKLNLGPGVLYGSINKMLELGATPTTVSGFPSIRIVEPRTFGSPPKSSCQSPYPITATALRPGNPHPAPSTSS
jgi:hypothetical protein